jgi:hypothetical protein
MPARLASFRFLNRLWKGHRKWALPLWLLGALLSISLLAMDGQDPTREGKRGGKLRRPRQLDELYEAYCRYAESSRAAMLRVIVAPESRRSLCEEEAAISREEFVRGLARMSHDMRIEFIRLITLGYDLARVVKRDELLKRYGPGL